MAVANRRVVTGLDDNGKSCFISDSLINKLSFDQQGPGAVIWSTTGFPVDNSGNEEGAKPLSIDMFEGCSSFFIMFEVPIKQDSDGWHATNTIDYLIVISGKVKLELEAGQVILSAGDVIVDRGVIHRWETIGDEPAKLAAVLVKAHPLGAGQHFDHSAQQRMGSGS